MSKPAETFDFASNLYTNPRRRRAYAHALAAQALATQLSVYRLAAVEAAIAASHTKKGRTLGKEILRAVTRSYPQPPGPRPGPVQETYLGWAYPALVRAIEVVNGVLGGEGGVSLTKPQTADEYRAAAESIAAHADIEGDAHTAQARGDSVMRVDWSVPGALGRLDTAHALLSGPRDGVRDGLIWYEESAPYDLESGR